MRTFIALIALTILPATCTAEENVEPTPTPPPPVVTSTPPASTTPPVDESHDPVLNITCGVAPATATVSVTIVGEPYPGEVFDWVVADAYIETVSADTTTITVTALPETPTMVRAYLEDGPLIDTIDCTRN